MARCDKAIAFNSFTATQIVVLVFWIATLVNAEDIDCANAPPDQIIVFPHEYNCSIYYECVNGEKIIRECSEGLWFNAKTETCDYPEESGCTETTTSTISSSTSASTTEIPTTQDSLCKNEETAYFPHKDCSKYIECYHGKPYVMDCPDGLWFNPTLEHCVSPELSECTTASTTSILTSTTTAPSKFNNVTEDKF